MEKVFEASELELADVQGDPSQVIEVQAKVKELLHANRQRQQPLLDEIAERGAWALPGVINAMYVWMNDLEVAQTQEMVAKLMSDLARGNPAATSLLFRTGIVETPFPVPRAICSRALETLEWRPDQQQTERLRHEIGQADRLGDVQTVLDFYRLLLRAGGETDLAEARKRCMSWAQEKRAEAGTLLRLLVDRFPSQTVAIVAAVFLATAADYRDKNLAVTLLKPLRPIPAGWLEDETVLRVSREVLSRLRQRRHTAVEYLWSYAVGDCRAKAPERWHALMPVVSDQVMREKDESVTRYWFSAVGQAGEMEYIIEQSSLPEEPFGTMAALQLFFQVKRSKLAKQSLDELQHENPGRYQWASDQFKELIEHAKEEGVLQRRGEVGQITDRKS